MATTKDRLELGLRAPASLEEQADVQRRKAETRRGKGMLGILLFCVLVGGMTGTARGQTLPEAIEIIRPSIIQIREDISLEQWKQRGGSPLPRLLGTGFLVNDTGYAITAYHVVKDASTKPLVAGFAQPNTPSGDETNLVIGGNFSAVPVTVIDTDPLNDIALLQLKQNPLKDRRVAALSLKSPRDGAAIGISGYPLNFSVLVTTAGGMATSAAFDSGKVRDSGAPPWFVVPETNRFYLADATVNPGNSGGPVYLVENGAVIGICIGSTRAQVVDQQNNPVVIQGTNPINLYYRSGLTVVVPIRYAVALLKKHNVSFQER